MLIKISAKRFSVQIERMGGKQGSFLLVCISSTLLLLYNMIGFDTQRPPMQVEKIGLQQNQKYNSNEIKQQKSGHSATGSVPE